jgi:recombination DNA repair RAD52 pathway protein
MDIVIRAYNRLVSLKQNLSKDNDIREKYVEEYHEIIDILAKETESSLDEFKVSEDEIRYRVTSSWPSIPLINQEAGNTYSKERYCEGTMFFSKLDALLSYFEIKYLSQEKPEIGFTSPEN